MSEEKVVIYFESVPKEYGTNLKLYTEKPPCENGYTSFMWAEDPKTKSDSYFDNQAVTELSVISKRKSPFLTSIISRFTNLVKLSLANNNLKEVPECLREDLILLEHLDLSHNQIQKFEFIPSCYKKLQVLKLNDNYFTNIPKWILQCECPNLIEFWYNFNKIESLEHSLFYLSRDYKLKSLRLVCCCLIEQDLMYLKTIKTLEELDISNMEVATKNLNRFSSCDSLFDKPSWIESIRILKLNKLGISVLTETISFLKNLQVLELRLNSLTWLPEYFPYLDKLEVLDLSKNNLTSLPSDFGYLINLKVLKMSDNQLNEIEGLSYLKKLKHLDLHNNELDSFELCIKQYDFLDLELNYFDTEQFGNNYESKRDSLRLLIDEIYRGNGKKQLEDYNQFSDESRHEDNFEEEDEQATETSAAVASEIEEYWEVKNKPDGYVSLCSPSDEEWTGLDVCERKSVFINSTKVQKFEDYIYVDAD